MIIPADKDMLNILQEEELRWRNVAQEEELRRGTEELQEWIDRGDRIAKAAFYELVITRYGKVLLEIK